jgi:ADP-L-glycero-D-manno-heptose 6-epimerase
MSKPIVITGAAGFIGRNVISALNARGQDNLLLVDTLGHDEKWKNLIGLRFEDLVSPSEFLAKMNEQTAAHMDAVIHLGACSATTEKDADYLLTNNYHYTRTLCEACHAAGTRFVYASSAATYGDGSHVYSDEDTQTPTLIPLNMYGYSKHLFDLWALQSKMLDRCAGLKYFNVFGPFEDHKADMRSVVNKSYEQIKKTGEVSLFKSYRPDYKDGHQKRDFIYVKDAVDITLYFVDHRDKNGLYNCGTGNARTWLDLATAVFTAMNLKPKIKFIEMPDTLKEKYQYFTQADVTKLRRSGYTAPFIKLEDAVKDYVATYLTLSK